MTIYINIFTFSTQSDHCSHNKDKDQSSSNASTYDDYHEAVCTGFNQSSLNMYTISNLIIYLSFIWVIGFSNPFIFKITTL